MDNKSFQRFGWLRRSSTLRLSLLLSLVFALGFVVAISVALSVGKNAIEERMDTTLAALARGAAVSDRRRDSAAMIVRPLHDLRGLPSPMIHAAARGGGTVKLKHELMRSEIWRVLVAPNRRGAPVMVALPLDDSEQAQELLAGILWTTALVVIIATLAIGLWAGLVSQGRLVRINTTLSRLAAGDLTARTGHRRSRDDLDDIARELDHTAAELERLVTQTRHLSASIAHDLRTPLARLQAQLEMLPEGNGRAAALEEAARLSAIFDTIMRVARIEAGHGRDGFEAISLAELASELAETFGPVVEDGGKALVLDLSSTASVQADQEMLVQAVANLIQNALVHGGDKITLFVRGNAIGVEDNGPGVDPALFDEITKPMVRLDAARTTDGSGLGLALVRAVAERHGAKLELAEHQPQGLRVTLYFAEL